MSNTVGSILACTIEGIPYNVAADVNASHILTNYENSMVPTSGRSMPKKMKRVPAFESLVLICNDTEKDELKSFAEGVDIVKFSVTLASGSQYKSEGVIDIENVETEESRLTVKLLPSEDWTLFAA